MESNTLYYGDNLPVLREHFPDACVDLIYLDPPFNSNRSYNVLFKETATTGSPAQIEAFEDTWHWGSPAEEAFRDAARSNSDTARLLKAMVEALGRNDVTAYLCMMAVRLVELHRVLKPAGSIYLHCDPTAGPYLRVLMDTVFGTTYFRNEIVWRRSPFVGSSKARATRFPHNHDLLLVYGCTGQTTFHMPIIPYTDEYKRRFSATDECGPYQSVALRTYSKETFDRLRSENRLIPPQHAGAGWRYKFYLDESKGSFIDDVWVDVNQINPVAKERLGYPTQKPLALLERIINASSNPDDIVLDPFCGCGTAVHAAHKLGRRWIGIDITFLAIGLIERRLRDAFPGIDFKEVGVPADLPGATALAARDPYQFQWWTCHLLGAVPQGGVKKKGADKGIDGTIPFIEGTTNLKRVIVSVKAGHIEPAYVQQLKGVIEGQGAPMGVLVTLREPTRAMRTEAVSAGSYHSDFWNRDYPRIQLITAAELLAGKRVEMPPQVSPFSQAAREAERGEQTSLM